MTISKFTLQVTVGRAINFQSCSASVSVEVDLEPGETVTQGLERFKPAILSHIKKVTREEVLQLAAEKRDLERQ